MLNVEIQNKPDRRGISIMSYRSSPILVAREPIANLSNESSIACVKSETYLACCRCSNIVFMHLMGSSSARAINDPNRRVVHVLHTHSSAASTAVPPDEFAAHHTTGSRRRRMVHNAICLYQKVHLPPLLVSSASIHAQASKYYAVVCMPPTYFLVDQLVSYVHTYLRDDSEL